MATSNIKQRIEPQRETSAQLQTRAEVSSSRPEAVESRIEGHSQAQGDVLLADWLDVSWFYPEGFVREAIVETADSYLVHGKGVTYKFYKHSSPVQSGMHTFAGRWRRACGEVADNRELAPDLFLGLRVLRWVDDEPHWISEFHGRNVNASQVPESADEVAVVLRRIPQDVLLSELLEGGGEISLNQLNGVTKVLSRFHHKRRREGMSLFLDSPDTVLRVLRRHRIEKVREFIRDYANFIDPFSRLALFEAKTFLERYLTDVTEALFERGKAGYICEVHGALRADTISIEPLFADGRSISLFGRGNTIAAPVEDVLADLASLSVDLEARGEGALATELEQRYFGQNPEARHDVVYSFYLVSTAIIRAAELFRSGEEAASPLATQFLAFALRVSLGLRGPFLVAIGGVADHGRSDAARAVSELSGATLLTFESVRIPLHDHDAPPDMVFDSLCDTLRRDLAHGNAVVIEWPLNRLEERLLIGELAAALRLPYLLVQCSMSHESLVNRQMQSGNASSAIDVRRLVTQPSPPWQNEWASPFLPSLMLETTMPQPELALMILRALGKR